ncbi:uncharacterized protein LOC106073737 [Biomphalaria glabrata]|uniref:Uncharacterized protein LOC106073737 n=1 Tax=Biomphalaria glabrata TaxID=6526 RepID=A0A9W3AX04_BIOGL|nr:uncharacterized protein LOC106073737 [Biomphalaria glabrata]KAI8746478.1 CAunnamed protein product [Biomphalaria glabrata]
MTSILAGLKLRFGLRELFYASLCIVLGYLLRVRDSYSLNPVWRKRSEVSKFANGKFMTDADRCPPPIVTDLEGDGVNEIVLISNDLLHLNILAMPSLSDDNDRTLAHVAVKNKVELTLRERMKGYMSRPYSMGVGYVAASSFPDQTEKQIIVVVSDDWQVLCFSHDLKLMWHQLLPLPVTDLNAVEVKSLAVQVSPFTIEKNHKDLVVVAGSFRHKTHKADLVTEVKMGEENLTQNNTMEYSAETENETLTHFSTFALSAEDGLLLWKHTAGDFEEARADKKSNSLSDLHWKLSLHHKKAHKGEAPWSDYGDQLDQFLPHLWADNSDTEILMARVNKQFGKTVTKEASDPQNDKMPTSSPTSSFLPDNLMGLAYGNKKKPRKNHEQVKNPNSIVIRSPEGLQVLSLVTGQPRTTLHFPADRSLYLDMDKDGHVEKMVWDLGQYYSPCYLDLWRLTPVQEKIDQISLCTSKRLFWTRSWSLEEDIYKKIPPKIIKSLARKSGVLRHFLGHNLFEDNSYDIIIFGGQGRVSSIGLDGTIHWQTMTESKWGDISLNIRRSGRPTPDNLKEEFMLSFQPGRIIMPLHDGGAKVAVAVSGWNTLTVVDLVEGTLLAHHSIPAPPTAPLVYGDFDNDGLVDIILTCKKGYIGFALKLQHNYELTVLYTISVFLIIILFSWLISTSSQGDNDSDKDSDKDDGEEDDVIGGDDRLADMQ